MNAALAALFTTPIEIVGPLRMILLAPLALREPVRRAELLLELRGVPVGGAAEPKVSTGLLMEMMEVGEELSEVKRAGDLDGIGRIGERVRARQRKTTARLAEGVEAAGEERAALAALLPLLGELRHLARFIAQLEAAEDRLLGRGRRAEPGQRALHRQAVLPEGPVTPPPVQQRAPDHKQEMNGFERHQEKNFEV